MPDASEAVDFLRLVSAADSVNRAEALEDLKFRYGDQWPLEIVNSRKLESRPALTINETDAYLRKIENQQRQQRPRMNPHPVGSRASIEVAKTLKGLCRHIEVNSDADNAYDLSFSYALTMGVGYFRLYTDYIRDDSFDQDIYIGQIENPFTVYFDPNSSLPDGSDAERCLVTDMMRKEDFKRKYPGAQMEGFKETVTGEVMAEWLMKEDIRLAEYMYIEKKKAELVMLSDRTTFYGDDLPPEDVLKRAGIEIMGTRPSYRKVVRWCKQTAFDILEEKVIPGRFIPVIPVYGISTVIDGKRRRFGLVRFARDPQEMINFWQTAMTESAAMAPKAKWLIAEGQDEGHENEFAQANTRAFPVLRYKTVDVEGKPAPPPVRIDPPGVDGAALQNVVIMSENLKRILGVYDPQVKTDGNKSGKAIRGEAQQSEESTYNFFDNLTRSIKHAARIILNWTPEIYDVERQMRIVGDDGKPSMVTLNEKTADESGAITVKNDVTVAEYDVVMDTGPGLNTKRQEAVEVMTQILAGHKELFPMIGDLVFRNMDFPGAETIADRLAASNPLAQIDEKSDIPPRAQVMIKGLQQQLQQAQQLLQQAGTEIKYKQGIEQMRQDGETRRELMRQTSDAHEREITRAQKAHDTETFALSAQHVAEINALAKLLTSKTEHGQRLREMLLEFEHATQLQDKQLAAKSAEQEPEAKTLQ